MAESQVRKMTRPCSGDVQCERECSAEHSPLVGREPERPSTCPLCSYALGSNWRHCERCREGMAPQPDAFELESMQLLVEKATSRIIQAQTALIARLTAENAELRRELGK